MVADSGHHRVVHAHHMKPPDLHQKLLFPLYLILYSFSFCPLILSRFRQSSHCLIVFNQHDDDEKTTGRSSRSSGSGISSCYCEPTNRAWVPIVPPQL